jgi:lipoprotein-releasing system permease protein
VIGIAVITAALVILLSAFNGIESMIEKLYSDFDTDITIRSNAGKTFSENQVDFSSLLKVDGVKNVSRAIEEVVVLKHEKKWVNASLVGVDSSFLSITRMTEHMVDGKPVLTDKNGDFGILGASLLDKLGGFIPEKMGYEQVILYAPKRDSKVRLGSNPFHTSIVNVAGRMNFNREVNAEMIVLPIQLAKEVLNYNDAITAIYIDVESDISNEEVKQILLAKLGSDFDVKTNYEKNELIYKTSKSEKVIVLIILVFIFILAAFNLIASLTMLFVEKKENVQTMIGLGADQRMVFRIFFIEGVLIAGKGIFIGLLIGYGICLTQVYGGYLTMPNSGGEPFPVKLSFQDGLLIVSLVSVLSFLFSYLPVRYLLKKNFGHLHY